MHDKWGGLFLEFAAHAAGDLQTPWGEVVPVDRINVGHMDPANRRRPLATAEHGDERRNCSRYDEKSGDRAVLDALVEELVIAVPQVVGWFETGSVGPNISPFSDASGFPPTWMQRPA